MSLSALEHRFFKGSPSSMITTLASIAAVLLVPGFYMRVRDESLYKSIRCTGTPESTVRKMVDRAKRGRTLSTV